MFMCVCVHPEYQLSQLDVGFLFRAPLASRMDNVKNYDDSQNKQYS